MKLTSLRIENYRALRSVYIPLSKFVCLIGENNVGKSSILQALSLFTGGDSLKETDYFDPHKDVTVSVSFSEVVGDDLARLGEEHRRKIEPLVSNAEITFVRQWGMDGKSQLGYFDELPTDPRFAQTRIQALTKGRMTANKVQEVLKEYPELQGQLSESADQETVRTAIHMLGQAEPPEKKQRAFAPIPTGSGFSLAPLLPEVIYIQAVKNLKDETKVTQGSSFGKILSIVTGQIEPLLAAEKTLFQELSRKITRVVNERGEIEDHRLKEVQAIEGLIGGFLNETFANVSIELEIPPPSISSVLSTAQIVANDGMRGSLDQKGDGLRRAVVFAILRTYVQLAAESMARAAKHKVEKEPTDSPTAAPLPKVAPRGYLLLFEEPELFLHPDAQRVLFDALRVFSKDHHVVVTTHSPMFLGPQATETFVRLTKVTESTVVKPFTRAIPVSLQGIEARDEFQIICFENNSAAFFARRIVLVEGDSDLVVFPHVAALLNAEWTRVKTCIAFTRVNGKGSIQRYRKFFERFETPVFVIADLDIIEQGLHQLGLSEAVSKLRADLLNEVHNHLAPQKAPLPKNDDIKKAHADRSVQELWNNVRECRKVLEADGTGWPEFEAAVDLFFSWEKKHLIREALQNPPNEKIARLKRELLAALRDENVFVLTRGALEAYYPAGLPAGDKPTRAQLLCDELKTREQALGLCDEVQCHRTEQKVHEFELILGDIYGMESHVVGSVAVSESELSVAPLVEQVVPLTIQVN